MIPRIPAGHACVSRVCSAWRSPSAASAATGAPGGLITPTLVMGAAMGGTFGWGMHALLPATGAGPETYAIVGMGAFMTGSLRVPLTAAWLVLELTGGYALLLPTLAAVGVAAAVARAVQPHRLYDAQLHLRGEEHHAPEIRP